MLRRRLLLCRLRRYWLFLFLDVLGQLLLLRPFSQLVLWLRISRLNLRGLLSRRLPVLLRWQLFPPYTLWWLTLRLLLLRLLDILRKLLLLRAFALQFLWLSVSRLALLLLRRRVPLPLLRWGLDLSLLRLPALLRWLGTLSWLRRSALRRLAFLLRRLLAFRLTLLARIAGIAAAGLSLCEDNRPLAGAVRGGAPLRQGDRRQYRTGKQEVTRLQQDILDL